MQNHQTAANAADHREVDGIQPDHSQWTLAGLLICPNRRTMAPGRRLHRIYLCACGCGAEVDADLAETTVWERVTRLRPWLVKRDTPHADRGATLRTVLARINFRPGPRLRLIWQPNARHAHPPA